jgi:hypothetical protein
MQNFILCVCENLCDTIPFSYGSGTVINYGSGSDFLKSYGFVPVPVPHGKKLRFLRVRFNNNAHWSLPLSRIFFIGNVYSLYA